jgi:hypothetical protein
LNSFAFNVCKASCFCSMWTSTFFFFIWHINGRKLLYEKFPSTNWTLVYLNPVTKSKLKHLTLNTAHNVGNKQCENINVVN